VIKNAFETKKQEIINDRNFNFANETKEKIAAWNPFNVCYCSPFFDSRIMFGITSGFDIVIGNPPYVQVPRGIFSKEQFPYSEGKDKGKQNLYKVFVEQSYNLVKDNGIATMIVQSSLMCDLSSQFTRELLLTKTEIDEILEFPKKAKNREGQVFENVLQGTCIYRFKKEMPNEDRMFKVSIDNDVTTLNNLQFESLKQNELLAFYPNGYFIPLIKQGEFKIISKMQEKSVMLNELLNEKSQGDLNLTTESKHFSTTVSNTKLVRGKNVHRFLIDTEFKECVLNDYKSDICNKNMSNQYLVCQQVTGTIDKYRLHFALTNNNNKFLFGNSVNKFLLKNQNQNWFILGIMNSKIMNWYFRKTSTNNHVNIYEIEQLPIPNATTEQKQSINSLVEYLILLKNGSSAISNIDSNDTICNTFERVIDACVYELYFEEEIKANNVDVSSLLNETLSKISSLTVEQQIKQLYTELNKYKNKIRDRIILQETRSESVSTIIKATEI
jgi:Alw26I/Eco31I/Esp3I family type II restriction m6 adenine DNA methyltransferase